MQIILANLANFNEKQLKECLGYQQGRDAYATNVNKVISLEKLMYGYYDSLKVFQVEEIAYMKDINAVTRYFLEA